MRRAVLSRVTVRRSSFAAPGPARILAGPVLTDVDGRRAVAEASLAVGDGDEAAFHEGAIGLKAEGLVFFPKLPSAADTTEALEAALGQPSVPQLLQLAGMALNVFAHARTTRTTADFLADPRTTFVPFLDVVEVAVVQARRMLGGPCVVEVACEDVEGGARAYRFGGVGGRGDTRAAALLASVLVERRVRCDLAAAEAAARAQEVDPYLPAAAGLLAAGGNGAAPDEAVAAQARELWRSALECDGRSPPAAVATRMRELLSAVLPDYRRIPDIDLLVGDHRELLAE